MLLIHDELIFNCAMIQNTKIDIIRHGEPIGGPRFRGHGVDDPLSEKGWEQMWNAVGGLLTGLGLSHLH